MEKEDTLSINQAYQQLKDHTKKLEPKIKQLEKEKHELITSRTYRIALLLQKFIRLIPFRKKVATPVVEIKEKVIYVSSQKPRPTSATINFLKLAETRYLYYSRTRTQGLPFSLLDIQAPVEKGLVSIVLPVYNGGAMLCEAIDSILTQGYQCFELIAIDDGSTDNTLAILQAYAANDNRIRVFSQQNQKLPRTLSYGFSLAKGEYVTWTSADNRLKPCCIKTLVTELENNSAVGMVFGNIDVIDECGKYILDNRWLPNPKRTQTVLLPHEMLRLNVVADNYINAAFLYHAKVSAGVGDYSSLRFTTEDYDYWMRINETFGINHTKTDDPLYEYRFHSKSLTAKDDALGITANRYKLMLWDSFRRAYFLRPLFWKWFGKKQAPSRELHGKKLVKLATIKAEENQGQSLFPLICVADDTICPNDLPENSYKVLVAPHPLQELSDGWNCCISETPVTAENLLQNQLGWFYFASTSAMLAFVDIRSRNQQLLHLEKEAENSGSSTYSYTCALIVTTVNDMTKKSLEALFLLNYKFELYEILVLADPNEVENIRELCDFLMNEFDKNKRPHLRIITAISFDVADCHTQAVWEARGEYVLFCSEKSTCPSHFLQAFDAALVLYPDASAVCGMLKKDTPLEQLCFGYDIFSEGENISAMGCVGFRRNEICAFGGFLFNELLGLRLFNSGWEKIALLRMRRQNRTLVKADGFYQTYQTQDFDLTNTVQEQLNVQFLLEQEGLLPYTLTKKYVCLQIAWLKNQLDNDFTEYEKSEYLAYRQILPKIEKWENINQEITHMGGKA